MPKAAAIQTSFGVGEASPILGGRVDSPRYKEAMATCLNYIPTLQGPIIRRPGTKYANAVVDATKPPVLIPFQFSITQAYMLEFGDGYVRFYANGGLVLTTATTYQVYGFDKSGTSYYNATRADQVPFAGDSINLFATLGIGAPVLLSTPYAYADLAGIRWAQSADTLYLVHPKYPVQKLQRYGNALWTMKTVYFQDGPYLPLNTYSTLADGVGITLTPSGTSGTVTVTAGPSFAISGAANNGSGLIRITSATHNFVSGQKIYIASIFGTMEANNTGGNPYWIITVISPTTFDLIGSAFVNAWTSGGTAYPALFKNNLNGQVDVGRPLGLIVSGARYWGVIGNINSAASVQFYVDPTNTLPGTAASTAWQIGVYNGYLNPNVAGINGFPSTVCFHQNRLVFGAPPNFPQQIDASKIGNFENFAPSVATTLAVTSSNAYQFTLNSQDSNALQWLKSSAQGLLSGSSSAEWTVTPSTQGDAITPTNVNAVQSSAYGSASVDAVQLGNAALYVQRAKRKIREMNYFWQAGTFKSTDMSELSEHITLPSVIKLAVQKETYPLVWAIRSDGMLATMSYDRSDQNLRVGWARHQLGGQSDASGTNPIVLSMAVIPSPDASFDQVWLVVQRWVNGARAVSIEYMTKVFDSSVAQEDSYHFDYGITYDVPLTITGISIASTAVVTSTAHGLSNGDQIRIVNVIGLYQATTDINGNVTKTNLVNGNTFVVAGVTTDTFQLNDFNGNPVSSVGYSIYISGGQVRKMVITISGLTWLANETVSIVADGAPHPNVVVSNSGSITLNYRAAKVQIGYDYNSDGQLMRPEAGAADGSSIGHLRRVCSAAVMMHRTANFYMGMSFTNLFEQKLLIADQQQADQAAPLFSGIHRDGVESGHDLEGQFCFRQNGGMPGMIQAITLELEENDV